MRDKLSLMVAVLVIVVAVLSMTMFTVSQRQFAIVFQLGEVKEVIMEPGLNFKLPLIQNVRYLERRILTMDTSAASERFLTSEKQNVIVDYFVKWRIIDPRLYYESVAGEESRAVVRLNQAVNAGLREEFGKRTIHEVVSGERNMIMEQMSARADHDLRSIGVQIVDVRLKRVELPPTVSSSVYSRMEAERKRVANERRSQGEAEAETIRADADRQRDVIVAEAYGDSQRIMGEGEAKAAAIYSAMYGRDPEFYAFYRSLEAYRESFGGKEDVMVVDPSSEFFKYLKSSRGGRTAN
ncbi:protein HflC [Betaproteobacteria bacterium]|nr:protein HflC [Betaproteobacteria bacterium]GHU06631.1 protein HflC [Betaproteobacteria bacterium]